MRKLRERKLKYHVLDHITNKLLGVPGGLILSSMLLAIMYCLLRKRNVLPPQEEEITGIKYESL